MVPDSFTAKTLDRDRWQRIQNVFERALPMAIATSLRDSELPKGKIVGRYRALRLLGQGGMGAV